MMLVYQPSIPTSQPGPDRSRQHIQTDAFEKLIRQHGLITFFDCDREHVDRLIGVFGLEDLPTSQLQWDGEQLELPDAGAIFFSPGGGTREAYHFNFEQPK